MRNPSALRFVLLVPLVALLLGGPMNARSFGAPIEIFQQATVIDGTSRRTDQIDDGGTGIIPRDVFSEISSPPHDPLLSFSAAASVGRFGEVGLMVSESSNFRIHTTGAQVQIGNNEFVNLTRNPLHVVELVVIDGGMMSSVFTRLGSDILYNYGLQSTIFDPATGHSSHREFVSFGDLLTGPTGLSFTVSGGDPLTTNFVDLGATFLPTAFDTNGNPISGTVTIPTSFPTFDLGVIPPDGRLHLQYLFEFTATTAGALGGFESQLQGQFSDPFHLSTNPALGTLIFEPVAAVPGPSGAILIGIGGLVLLVCAWRRRAWK